MRGNTIYKSEPSDLDLWTNNLNVNIGHVSLKINQYLKYESYVITSSQDNEQKACEHNFYICVTLTFNQLIQNQQGSCHHQYQSACKYISSGINSYQDNDWKPFILFLQK